MNMYEKNDEQVCSVPNSQILRLVRMILPGNRRMMLGARRARSGRGDQGAFGRIGARMLGRIVAKPDVETRPPRRHPAG